LYGSFHDGRMLGQEADFCDLVCSTAECSKRADYAAE